MKKRVLMFVLSVFLMAGILPVRALGAEQVTVTFNLINGAWPEGGLSRKVAFEAGHTLTEEDVPTDMIPNSGFGGGSWSRPPVGVVLDGNVTFRFSFHMLAQVLFDANGGAWEGGETSLSREAPLGGFCDGFPQSPVREGFSFVGWRTGDGLEFSGDTVIEKSLTVYAHWREDRTLTLDANDGDWPGPRDVTLPGGLVEETSLPKPPSREGYVFDHWNTCADGSGQSLSPGTILNENTTAYAQWRRIFILFLEENYENKVSEQGFTAEKVGISSHTFTLPDAVRPGHSLLGWNTAPDGSGDSLAVGDGYTVTEEGSPARLYAQWQRCSYQVRFEGTEALRDCLWGDPLPDTDFPAPPSPPEGRFRFGGWYTAPGENGSLFGADTPVTENLTVYPHWVQQAQVCFQIKNGTWAQSGTEVHWLILDAGTPLADKLPAPVPDPAYKETGSWDLPPFKASEGAVFTFTCEARKRFQITFDTGDEPVEVLEGQCAQLPIPSLSGSRFDGWYTTKAGGEKFENTTVVTKNVSLYARWTPVFTLTYHANGGENAPPPEVVEVGGDTKTFTISAQIPTRTGYSFEGWAESDHAETASLHGGDLYSALGDATLYAVWKLDTDQVTVHFFDRGTETEKRTLTAGGTLGDAMPKAPEWKNHLFLGWSLESEDAAEILTKDTVISQNTSVYAKWREIPRPTVTFMDRGNVVDWFTLAPGASMGLNMPAEPSRAGFTFRGWRMENGTKLDAATPVSRDVTVYADWERITRGVLSCLDGEQVLYQITLDLGAKIGDNLPPEPTRPGFHFLGWNTREDGTGSKLYRSTVLRGDLTVWAQWEEIEYVTLTFYNLFGDTEQLTLEQNTKAAEQFPAAPAQPGYSFRGWYTQVDGDGRKVTKSTKIQEDTELYACWNQKDTTNAKTGDDPRIYLWMGLLLASGSALLWLKKR